MGRRACRGYNTSAWTEPWDRIVLHCVPRLLTVGAGSINDDSGPEWDRNECRWESRHQRLPLGYTGRLHEHRSGLSHRAERGATRALVTLRYAPSMPG